MAFQTAVEALIAAVREQPKDGWGVGTLIAPPAVEFAIYKKLPGAKKRSDARQGTIDQDPDFMAFLESLANPDAANRHGCRTCKRRARQGREGHHHAFGGISEGEEGKQGQGSCRSQEC